MTRPLVVVTTSRDIVAELAMLDGPVLVTDGLDGVPALFDEAFCEHWVDPIVAFDPDAAQGWDAQSPPYDVVLLYTSAGDVDWGGLFWLAPLHYLQVPYDMGMLRTLLSRVPQRRP